MPAAAQPTDAAVEAASPTRAEAAAGRWTAALDRNVFTICVLGGLALVQAQIVQASVIGDAWYTLVSGRLIDESGLPRTDHLTVMSLGRRWVDQQWLAHLGLYDVWRAGGWGLAAVVIVFLYAGAFGVVAVAARRGGASDRSVALVALPCFLAGLPNTVFRAQLPAYVLFALVLALLLADARRASRRVLLVLPLLILWANIHGSVVFGAALVALRGLSLVPGAVRGRSSRARAAVLCLLPWLCTLASPYALHLPGYYRSILDNSTLSSSLAEWGPSTLRGQPVFFALLLAGLWLGVRSRAVLTPFAELALWASALMGLLAVRNQVWFALAAAAILPYALDAAWRPSQAPRRRTLNTALVLAVTALAAIAIVRAAVRPTRWFERDYPAAAAAAVGRAARSEPELRVFANERYADWLLLEQPRLAGRVAYDIRFELLTSDELTSVFDFRTERGLDWQRAANGYGLLVLDPGGDGGAIRYYSRLAGTRVLFRDPHVVVLRVRQG